MPSRKNGRLPLFPPIAALLLLSLLGWAASYAYVVVNADVTMPDWSVNLLNIAAEFFSALRVAVMLAFVACFVFADEPFGRTVTVPAAGILSNTLIGLLATWLSQGFGEFNPVNFILEIVLTAVAFLIARAMKSRRRRARTSHERGKWSAGRAAVFCAWPAALLPLFYAVLDLIDHIDSAGGYSAEVFQAGTVYFAGILIRRILIYAVLAPLAGWAAMQLLGGGEDGTRGA